MLDNPNTKIDISNTKIDISSKIYFQKNGVTYAYYINSVEAKFLSNMQRISYSSSFNHVKIERVINIRNNFCCQHVQIFHGKQEHNKRNVLRL